MRILQIIPSVSLVYGGPSQMVLGLSSALAKAGIEVTILTTNSNGDAGQPPLDVPLNCPVEQDGYQIRYFRCSPFRRYKFSLDLLQWLNSNAKNYDLAHIHALFSPVCSLAATVARMQKLPYILRPLGTLDPADLRKKKLLKQLYAALLEKPNIAGSSAIHFTSLEEAKVSERFGVKTKDLVLPLGVNLPKQEKEGTEFANLPSPVILFMSRVDPKKGLDLLIPALQNLANSGINFHFVLAGSNPQDPEYEEKIRSQISTTLPGNVTITGFVTGDRKLALLQKADLFVLPSYYENFGIAVAEAMAAGTPVCITRGVYIWEDILAAEAGWVCDRTVESLTETLRLALQDSIEMKRRGLNAKQLTIKNYSWQAIADQTIQAYQQIISSSSN
ncbi:glycosyl transferase group 1 [[Phormidium ambiguum] IAM M-71]|uniref:Glycosyl transferase group 1 n=1 Tax=[Phormidium ambiguum] IAM M-71 TaxID=454136 RepID=A0A1U7IG56_9CYAN|nr:hormogonium polysaccharide biosynthesis glycosyltransferase HpsP [Phormidium ambiguum]OKH36051.1 glycosyl transferase group 1 [Phormidium ambiguum IAM M-71]